MNRLLKELSDMDALAVANLNYAKSLALLRALQAGEIQLDQVTMTSDGWTVTAAPPQLLVPSDDDLSSGVASEE